MNHREETQEMLPPPVGRHVTVSLSTRTKTIRPSACGPQP